MKKERSKHNNDRGCFYCGVLFSLHRKCKRCRILLHLKNEKYVCEQSNKQYTLESKENPEYCDDCYVKHIKNHDNN